jgi:hypothetical protein
MGPRSTQNAPKTKAGLRTVALSDFATATLLAWQLRQAKAAEAAAEAWRTEGHVFTIPDAAVNCDPVAAYNHLAGRQVDVSPAEPGDLTPA